MKQTIFSHDYMGFGIVLMLDDPRKRHLTPQARHSLQIASNHFDLAIAAYMRNSIAKQPGKPCHDERLQWRLAMARIRLAHARQAKATLPGCPA